MRGAANEKSPARAGVRALDIAQAGGFKPSELTPSFGATQALELAREYEAASLSRLAMAKDAGAYAELYREHALAEHYGRLARQMTGAAYAR